MAHNNNELAGKSSERQPESWCYGPAQPQYVVPPIFMQNTKDFPRVDAQRCFVLLWVSSMNANHGAATDTCETLMNRSFARSTGVLVKVSIFQRTLDIRSVTTKQNHRLLPQNASRLVTSATFAWQVLIGMFLWIDSVSGTK